MRLDNFGRNTHCEPRHLYVPDSPDEVLEILGRHRGKKIRVVGRLHSWSEAPHSDTTSCWTCVI